MSKRIRHGKRLIAACLLLAAGLFWGHAVFAQQVEQNCLPTCDEADGRFLTIAGSGLETLTGQELVLEIIVPEGLSEFELGIFDGDSGKTSIDANLDPALYQGGPPIPIPHWDLGATTITYTLSADPAADASGTGGVVFEACCADLLDNEWFNVTVPTSADAQGTDGRFYYVLRVSISDDNLLAISNFKLRLRPPGGVFVLDEPFSFQAAAYSFGDYCAVYPGRGLFATMDTCQNTPADANLNTPEEESLDCPGGPGLDCTTYNGDFIFYSRPLEAPLSFTLWDGDLDHGSPDCTPLASGDPGDPSFCDSDDPNTEGAPFLPPWAVADALFEGEQGIGSPPDDRTEDVLVRTPSVIYHVHIRDDNGTQVDETDNFNPSGNREWEQYKLATPDANVTDADEIVPQLPSGVYEIHLEGMDMQNLNAWRVEQLVCVDEQGKPCDPPELPPCEVATLNAFETDANGTALAAGTIVDGPAGPWVSAGVQITGNPGPAMIFDSSNPTGGDTDLGTPHTDFGGPGVGAGGAAGTPGENMIGRNNVLIISEDGNTTNPDDNAGGGTLTFTFGSPVRVDHVGLLDMEEPGSSLRAYDANGTLLADVPVPVLGDNSFQLVPVNKLNVSKLEVVFAASGAVTSVVYCEGTGAIGDYVWNDVNGDGVQDASESGIPGVTVNLLGRTGEVIATTTTGPDGEYLFDFVPAGDYTVEVDPSTLPGGFAQTFDLDDATGPFGTPNSSGQFALAGGAGPEDPGEIKLDVDFGYQICGKCDGKVTTLTLQFLSQTGANIRVHQKKDSVDVFEGFVDAGGVFSFDGQHKSGTLGTEIEVYVEGSLNTKIHTSCSKPIGPGLVFGDFLVLAGESRNGGALCPLVGITGHCPGGDSDSDSDSGKDSDSDSGKDSDSDSGKDSDSDSGKDSDSDSGKDSDSDSDSGKVCKGDSDSDSDSGDKGTSGKCDGKVTRLELTYLGNSPANVMVIQKKDDAVVFSGQVAAGGTFDFVGTDKKGTLGTEIIIKVNGDVDTQIHTSCSKPIGPGLVSGSFEVVSGESRNGGPLPPL